MEQPQSDRSYQADEFQRQASEKQRGLIGEFVAYARTSRKWYLVPIIAVLLLFSVIMVLGSTVAAPFIYTLF